MAWRHIDDGHRVVVENIHHLHGDLHPLLVHFLCSARQFERAILFRAEALPLVLENEIAGACVIGIHVAIFTTWWLLVFIVFGAFIVVAYNLELFGGLLHTPFWFAFAWGAFPALTAYFASAQTVRGAAQEAA